MSVLECPFRTNRLKIQNSDRGDSMMQRGACKTIVKLGVYSVVTIIIQDCPLISHDALPLTVKTQIQYIVVRFTV